jgi:energy-coupling factor transporter ATP-binding protein EcfA2
MQLSKLRASSLRGLPADWPEVLIGERGLVIYGPNGVGKSSLVDAIEFALTNDSTLYAEKRQGVNWEAGAPHIRGGRMSVSVTVRDRGQDYVIAPGAAPPEIAAEWCNSAQTSRFVLRRHMLLRFLNAEPRHRYDQLEPFLNLESFLTIENALQGLANAIQTELASKEAMLRGKEQSLRTIFHFQQSDQISEPRLLLTLNIRLGETGLQEIKTLEEIGDLRTKVSNELGGNERDQRLAALHTLKGQAQKLTIASNYRQLTEQLAAASADLEKEISTRTGAVVTEFLVRGREILAQQKEDDCPICEQEIDRQAVMAKLDERIAADQRITIAKQSVVAKQAAALNPVKKLITLLQSFIDDWSRTVATPLPKAYGETLALLGEIVEALESSINSEKARDISARLSTTVTSHAPVIDIIDNLIGAEGGGARRQKLSDAMLMIRALTEEWPQCQAARKRVQAISKNMTTVDRLHGHAVEARKKSVQKLLDEVAGIANGLYEALHPGESLANSKLSVRPTEDGSVILQTQFYGREASPLLHYSESHLDTLGLCYFLALRRREADKQPGFKVLVLDDVMHSVDSRHRGRFAVLLKEKFGDHQIILTTHDRIFYDRVRQTFGTGGYNYLVLTGWDIERGPVRGDASTDLDRVLDEQSRLTRSAEELSAASGRLFEWLLRQLTERLEVAIPARFTRRNDIGSMWPPLAKKMKSQRHFQASYPTLVDDLVGNGWVRNELGAHYNEPEAPVDPEEVRQFAEHLATLYTATYCSGCSSFIKKLGDHDWRCDCGDRGYCTARASAQ